MNEIIQKYYDAATLSLASYVKDLSPNDTEDIIITKLQNESLDGNFINSQANQFTERFEILDHEPNTLSGYSGTVFRNKKTGEYTFAVRGTEFGIDFQGLQDVLLADLSDIGNDGIAIFQAIDMFNHYQRVIASSGDEIVQYTYVPAPSLIPAFGIFIPTKSNAQADGALSSVSSLTVTGHSLGGHLALIMGRLATDRVSRVDTFNAPGFDTNLIPGNDYTNEFFNTLRLTELTQTGSTAIATSFFKFLTGLII